MKFLLLVLAAAAIAAADPYDAWAQGRPQEAAPQLLHSARERGSWDAWMDAGLAAAAAGDRGTAVAALTEALNRAPEQAEIREALRALDVPLPTGWCDRAGPLGALGQGWSGVILLACVGLSLGCAVAVRAARGIGLLLAAAALAAALPGLAAMWADGRRTWLSAARDCTALDSTGTPLRALPAGTLLERASREVWAGRVLVRLGDGTLAYVAQADVAP